jgi:lysophospholipase L1-like esterase
LKTRTLLVALLCCYVAPSVAQSTWITRFESTIQEYEAADKRNPPPKDAMVITGSSTIRLWSTVVDDLAPLTVIPRGFGGSTIAELDYYLDRIVLAYEPEAVVIYEGDNDINSGKTPEYIVERFLGVIERIHDADPETRVFVIAIKPSIARWNQWPQTQRANALLEEMCAADERLQFVDPSKALLGSDGKPKPEYFVNDELHLSAAGYAAWTAAVRPALLEIEQRPRPPVLTVQ